MGTSEPTSIPAPDLQRRRWTLAAGVVLLLAAPLVPVGIDFAPGLFQALSNAVHFPLFAALTLLLIALGPRESSGTRRLVRPVAIASAAAASVEGAQAFVSRTPSLEDLLVGLAGVAMAAAAWALYERGSGWVPRAGHAAVSVVVMGLLLVPAWLEWRALELKRAIFPVLGDFEQELELRLWLPRLGPRPGATRLEASEEHAASGRRSLRVDQAPGSWAGVNYVGGRADWSGFKRLAWQVFNPGEAFELRLRVEDARPYRYETGFMQRFRVDPGWNRYEVALDVMRDAPPDGPLELDRVQRMAIFSGRDQPRRIWFLDDVRLVP